MVTKVDLSCVLGGILARMILTGIADFFINCIREMARSRDVNVLAINFLSRVYTAPV